MATEHRTFLAIENLTLRVEFVPSCAVLGVRGRVVWRDGSREPLPLNSPLTKSSLDEVGMV